MINGLLCADADAVGAECCRPSLAGAASATVTATATSTRVYAESPAVDDHREISDTPPGRGARLSRSLTFVGPAWRQDHLGQCDEGGDVGAAFGVQRFGDRIADLRRATVSEFVAMRTGNSPRDLLPLVAGRVALVLARRLRDWLEDPDTDPRAAIRRSFDAGAELFPRQY